MTSRLFLPPTNEQVHRDTRSRLSIVEQRTPEPQTGRFCLTAVGTTGGSDSLTSQPWRPWDGAVRLDLIMITLSNAAADDVTADVLVNGSSVGTATVTAGDTKGSAGVDGLPIGPSDVLTVELSIASGSLAGGETVQLWFRGRGGGSLVFPGASGGGGGSGIPFGMLVRGAPVSYSSTTPVTIDVFEFCEFGNGFKDWFTPSTDGFECVQTCTIMASHCSAMTNYSTPLYSETWIARSDSFSSVVGISQDQASNQGNLLISASGGMTVQEGVELRLKNFVFGDRDIGFVFFLIQVLGVATSESYVF